MSPDCADCGQAPSHGVVMLVHGAKVNGKQHYWRQCSRCWRKEQR